MKKIRDFSQIVGLLENGKFNPALSTKCGETLNALLELSETKDGAAVKGSLTVKLAFIVKDGTVEIGADFDANVPKRPRRTSSFWVVEDGALSTEHPSQHDMFGPREVSRTDPPQRVPAE